MPYFVSNSLAGQLQIWNFAELHDLRPRKISTWHIHSLQCPQNVSIFTNYAKITQFEKNLLNE